MGQIDIFCESNPVGKAIGIVFAQFGSSVVFHDYSKLLEYWSVGDLSRTALVLALSNKKDFNAVKASACLSRLRCNPVNYSGPMSIIPAPTETEETSASWQELQGIFSIDSAAVVASTLQMAYSLQHWPSLPHLACRPAWAMMNEAIALHHEINNFFNRIAEDLSADDREFAETLRKFFSQETKKG